jgi:hypothetical protein
MAPHILAPIKNILKCDGWFFQITV